MKILIGFRKFVFAMLVLTISVILLYFNYITGTDFAQIVSGVGVAFMGANIGERALESINNYLGSKGDKK